MRTRGQLLVLTLAPALALGAAAALAAGLADDAWARPGGGQSYSGGGGGSSSSGGGGGDAELIFFLIRLIITYPKIGIPLAVIVIGYFVLKSRRGRAGREESFSTAAAVPPRAGGDLGIIRKDDPDFSPIVWGDFVYRLYASAHQARARPEAMAALAPYLSEEARQHLVAREPRGVATGNVVIGAMRTLSVQREAKEGEGGRFVVRVAFESNMTSGDRTYFVEEVWTLARDLGVRSRPPGAAEALGCPNCGAPFRSGDNQRCEYCGEVSGGGRFDWEVASIRLVQSQPRPPTLTRDVEEVGTEAPTVIDPRLRELWAALTRDDPQVDADRLRARVELIFRELNAAWSALDAPRLRPYVSDGMFDYLRYWLDAYRQQGLRNQIDDAAVSRVTLVKIARDRYYDAVTVRLFASNHDYTVDGKGKVVAGSKRRRRGYSEYWTLIRGAGVRGPARADATCPQCGAGLKISMAGNCEHCGAHLTRGEFDWVLSKIEQDEAYSG
ncbi:MAG: TIM44-like domain-containing protein [Nannocystaceae bacterium]